MSPLPGAHVVALGGGRGLSVTLRAVAPWAGTVTGVVATADDGGSTGRLRESWDVPALGDVRRCVAALADPGNVWGRVLERRFDAGELEGHAVGNLLLLALTEELGDLQSACDAVAATAGIDLARSRVVPVTDDAVVLQGRTRDGTVVEGQVQVDATHDIVEVAVSPACTAASKLALEAIATADLVVLGPGSICSSVLAALVVGDVRRTLAATSAPVVLVGNLGPEPGEDPRRTVDEHLALLARHDVVPDAVLVDPGGLPLGSVDAGVGPRVATAPLVDATLGTHDPERLGAALRTLLPGCG